MSFISQVLEYIWRAIVTLVMLPLIGIELAFDNYKDGHILLAIPMILFMLVCCVIWVSVIYVMLRGYIAAMVNMDSNNARSDDLATRHMAKRLPGWLRGNPKKPLRGLVFKWLITIYVIWNGVVYLKQHALHELRFWYW